MSWVATVDGDEQYVGHDFIEFAADGHIARLTNFFEECDEIGAAGAEAARLSE